MFLPEFTKVSVSDKYHNGILQKDNKQILLFIVDGNTLNSNLYIFFGHCYIFCMKGSCLLLHNLVT